jgi:L-amino acid N-acyltransferase YncA
MIEKTVSLSGQIQPDIIIDSMQDGDWERVRAIYLEGLASGQASFETEAPNWEHWDEAHLRHSRLVARDGERVVAWAALTPISRRRCYAGVAEVSFYVSAAHRGRGLGKRLLRELVAASERLGIWTLYGSTFPENEASLQVQSACGFRVMGRRERIAQHHGVWRDTVITERRSRVVGV